MAQNRLTTRIVLRNDSTSNWLASKDQVLLKGEVGIEFLETGKVKMKVGDGRSTWEQLPYFGGDECHVFEATIAKGANHISAITTAVGSTTLNKGDIAIVKEAIYDETDTEIKAKLDAGILTQNYQYTAYVYGETANGTEWKAMDGNYSASNVYFDDDFIFTTNVGTVTGVTSSKTVDAAGKSVKQFFSGLFAKETHVTSATQPSVSITLTGAGNYEVGTTVSPSFTASFEDGKYTYGPEPTGATVTTWAITSTDNESWSSASGTCAPFVVADGENYSVTAKATHTQGDLALSNIGNQGTYRIPAGTKEKKSSAITGYRKQFYGAQVTPIDITSNKIRALNNCKPGNTFTGKYSAANANGFQITVPEGAKQVVVALYGRTLKNVYDHAAFGTDISGSFVEVSATTPVSVAGAENYTGVNYNVYVYTPDTALGANTYDVVIG